MTKLKISASTFAIAAMTLIGAGAAQADIQHNDDVIISFSLCVGNDCSNGESFGFDTMRLKENNLRVHFDDTSTSGSFPRNDWRLTANDSDNGGDSYFSIDDATAGRQVFRVDAGAPANSLRVDSGGDVGIGTSTPVTEIHVADGDTPTLRLEQNGSSGFTPQTFDVAANEANFFIRDVTNGSRLSFRIRPGAPESSIDIASDGDVGFGTSSPSAPLHVRRTDGTAAVLIEEASGTSATRTVLNLNNNGATAFGMTDTSIASGAHTGATWNIQNNGGEFRLTTAPGGAGEVEMALDVDGNMTLEGSLTTAGSCSVGCDRVFTEDYDLPSIEDHAAEMFSLGYLPNVGPTAESGPMNISDKVGRMLNELEHAHIYIAQQQEVIAEMNMRLAALESAQ